LIVAGAVPFFQKFVIVRDGRMGFLTSGGLDLFAKAQSAQYCPMALNNSDLYVADWCHVNFSRPRASKLPDWRVSTPHPMEIQPVTCTFQGFLWPRDL
jgi:hypothetical protein